MKKLFVANFKNYVIRDSVLDKILKVYPDERRYILCPSFLHIKDAVRKLKNRNISVGAQDVDIYLNGETKTGNINAPMLRAAKAKYCIIGHTETRNSGIQNQDVVKKAHNLLANKIKPIICITSFTNNIFEEVDKQINEIFSQIDKKDIGNVILAYEPATFIGASASASASFINEITLYIKDKLRELYKEEFKKIKILYGGSVSSGNIEEIFSTFVDGVLAARSSVDEKEMKKIVKLI